MAGLKCPPDIEPKTWVAIKQPIPNDKDTPKRPIEFDDIARLPHPIATKINVPKNSPIIAYKIELFTIVKYESLILNK
jgi:hypothetical protein